MALTSQNFSMYAGENKILQFTVSDCNGSALDLTDCDVIWNLSLNSLGSVFTNKITPLASGVDTIASSGIIKVYLNPVDTQSLEGVFYHEARIIDASGQEGVVAIGRVTIYPSITQ